jgi:DtxR family Mn-dependent transcriptional regulator
MYLITVAVAEEEGRPGPLALADLAGSLAISPVSANQMVRRLQEQGLVEYHPYHGVALTPGGRQAARRVLRGRRLWATFLVAHLGFTPEEADALACSLEHVTPPEAADRLAQFLGNPAVGPLGNPIPPAPAAVAAGRCGQ